MQKEESEDKVVQRNIMASPERDESRHKTFETEIYKIDSSDCLIHKLFQKRKYRKWRLKKRFRYVSWTCRLYATVECNVAVAVRTTGKCHWKQQQIFRRSKDKFLFMPKRFCRAAAFLFTSWRSAAFLLLPQMIKLKMMLTNRTWACEKQWGSLARKEAGVTSIIRR